MNKNYFRQKSARSKFGMIDERKKKTHQVTSERVEMEIALHGIIGVFFFHLSSQVRNNFDLKETTKYTISNIGCIWSIWLIVQQMKACAPNLK